MIKWIVIIKSWINKIGDNDRGSGEISGVSGIDRGSGEVSGVSGIDRGSGEVSGVSGNVSNTPKKKI